MEIFLDKRAVKQVRLSAQDAIEEGDTDTLREDIMEAFTDEQIEEVERRIDSGDFYDFVSEIIEEWSGDDSDEIFELLEAHLSDAGIDIKYTALDLDEDDEEEDDDDEEEEEEEEEEMSYLDDDEL